MLILGFSSLDRDVAVALQHDGDVVAAIENDKLTRSKTHGLPDDAIQFCLKQAGVGWKDLDAVAVASQPMQGWMRRSLLRARMVPLAAVANTFYEVNELGILARELNLRRLLQRHHAPKSEILNFNHHLCHAATAFYLSPYDKALILILDEDGDGTSGLLAVGEGTKIRPLRRIPFPNSLGWVYTQVTELLGFTPHKEEHKTQWLSLEGEPEFKQIFLDMMSRRGSPLPRLDSRYFNRGLTGRVAFSERFYRAVGLCGREATPTDDQRRCIAASLQQACSQIVIDLVKHFSKRYGMTNVCLGGGLFLNPLLVSSVEQETGLNQIFVPPAPGNAGCAIGAASLLWYQQANRPRRPVAAGVYWGPSFSRSEIKDTLDNSKSRYSLQITEERKIEAAVQLLQSGKIIGWYQGATEFGPRALGNRSVLASPWAPYVKENLNDFIKHREWFRPFALAITEEECERWFEASHSCHYMNSLARVKPGHALPEGFLLPDNRVRLHVVRRTANPSFWRLLNRFGETAPAPILVNTSFNLFGEPLVVRPRDAMRSYFCSGIDALLIDNFLLSKTALSSAGVPKQIAHSA